LITKDRGIDIRSCAGRAKKTRLFLVEDSQIAQVLASLFVAIAAELLRQKKKGRSHELADEGH